MFGGKAATQVSRQRGQGLAKFAVLAVEAAAACRRRQVVVNVAVGQMSERIDADSGQDFIADPFPGFDEARNGTRWHRDVMLELRSLQPLSFRLLFPNAPEMGALGIRRGNCAILDQFLLHALLQNRGEDFVQRYARRTGGKLNQQIDGRTRFERKGEALEVLQYQLQSHIAEEFQARQELACLVAQKSSESYGATIIGQGEQGGCPLLG